MDDVYQLPLKIEEGLKLGVLSLGQFHRFQSSPYGWCLSTSPYNRRGTQILGFQMSKFTNWEYFFQSNNKQTIKHNKFPNFNQLNGEGSNQQASNVVNWDANKGKNSMNIGYKKVGVTPLCLKYGGHDHYVVVCLSKGLHFCVEEP